MQVILLAFLSFQLYSCTQATSRDECHLSKDWPPIDGRAKCLPQALYPFARKILREICFQQPTFHLSLSFIPLVLVLPPILMLWQILLSPLQLVSSRRLLKDC